MSCPRILYFLCLVCFFISLVSLYNSPVLCDQPQNLEIGAVLPSEIQITLDGGTNQYGKQTIFNGGGINFGTVSFVQPGNMANGDAYIEKGNLRLEAVINVNIVFSGANSVAVDLSKLLISTNSFSETYYSLSLVRSDIPTAIFIDPRSNRVSTLTSQSVIPLRILFDIKPQQSGRIYDRFRITATAL